MKGASNGHRFLKGTFWIHIGLGLSHICALVKDTKQHQPVRVSPPCRHQMERRGRPQGSESRESVSVSHLASFDVTTKNKNDSCCALRPGNQEPALSSNSSKLPVCTYRDVQQQSASLSPDNRLWAAGSGQLINE
ncbi:hypothetical protein NQZ68_027550 [Dissostichus eleginoides]|nr:hypothetical protein NQZ68_027550 [Dissostichus eleginoides]